jgi:ceramide glucosyltransferase
MLSSAILSILIVGAACWTVAGLASVVFAARRRRRALSAVRPWPAVTLLKPVCGLEKNLRANLSSACEQDYPDYQVVYSVQRKDDPAIELLLDLQRQFGSERVTVAIEQCTPGLNGKINNLAGALKHARHEVLVISDSDIRLAADYLQTIVSPLADPTVGAVSSFFRATDANTWYERMELLTINADHFAIAMAAHTLGLFEFCFGASIALRRQTLEQIGGIGALADYLVEDHELGRRVLQAGLRLVNLDYVVDTTVDLRSAAHWWQKQTYWDQNTRAAEPLVFASTIALRIIPVALLWAALRGFDLVGALAVAAACVVRLGAAALVLGVALRDRAALRGLWLLPIKDVLSVYWFVLAFTKRTVIWRGVEMRITRSGRLQALTSDQP